MPDSSDVYFVNDYETLTLTPSGDSTDVVAGVKNVSIELSWGTFERFFTADSVERAASKQAELAIPVSIEYAFFDGAFVEEWLTSGAVTDSSDPPEFDLTGDFRSRDGDKQIEVEVTGINFENIPIFDGSENEFVVWGLEGEGSQLTNFDQGTVA